MAANDEARRFRIVFEHSNDGILIVDPERDVILDANPRACRLLGYSRDELRALGVSAIHPTDLARTREFARSVFERGYGWTDELSCRTCSGEIVPVEMSASVIEVEGKAWMIAMLRDLRERRLAEQRARELAQEQALRAVAEEALRMRDNFVSIASHELRTPLTAMQLAIASALRLAEQGAPPQQMIARLGVAERQVRRLARLIDRLFDSSIEKGELPVELSDVDLAAVIDEVVAQLRVEADRAGCTIDVRAGVPVVGRWDALLLEQVAFNLLSNAIKFGAGKPIDVAVSVDAGSARLTVTDHGIGIAPQWQKEIFGRFARAVSARRYGGFGLGLYTVRRILDALGGTIRVESAPGAGSTFVVELPCDRGQPSPASGSTPNHAAMR